MTTLLGFRRILKLNFPEVREAAFVTESRTRATAYCEVDQTINPEKIQGWIDANRPAGIRIDLCAVPALPAEAQEALKRQLSTVIPVDVLEDASITTPGIMKLFEEYYHDLVVGLRTIVGGVVGIDCSRPLTEEEEQELRSVLTALLPVEVIFSTISTRKARKKSTWTEKVKNQIERDETMLRENLSQLVNSGRISKTLPDRTLGTSTYLQIDGRTLDLRDPLALFDTVYFDLPQNPEFLGRYYGIELQEMIEALPTGRLIPILRHPPQRYHESMVEQLVEASPGSVMMFGELRLREIYALVSEHPILQMFSQGSEELRKLHAVTRNSVDDRLKALGVYLDAAADTSSRLRTVARDKNSLFIQGWFPLVENLDKALSAKLPIPNSRALELSSAMQTHFTCEGINATPMVIEGSVMLPYLQLVGRKSTERGVKIMEPTLLGEILLGWASMSLSECAKTFDETTVKRMRAIVAELQNFPAAQRAESMKELNQHARRFSKIDGMSKVVSIVSFAASLLLTGAAGILATLALTAARPALEDNDPDAADTLDSLFSLTPKTAVMLAKVRHKIT